MRSGTWLRVVQGLALDVPGGLNGVEEVRRLLVAQPVVVVVALGVAVGHAAAGGGPDRSAELLRNRPVHGQRAEARAAAVVVIDDEGVVDREDRGIDRRVGERALAVDAAVALALGGLRGDRPVRAALVVGGTDRMLDANEVV